MRAKLLVSLVLAATASSVFALPSDPAKHPALLEVALTGGGFKIDTNDSTYGINATTATGVVYPSGSVVQNAPKYKFGGSIGLGYFFSDSTINVDATYTSTRANRTDTTTSIFPNLLVPAVAGGAVDGFGSSYYNFKYDFANLEIGSLTRINCNGLILNPQVGLSWARLNGEQFVSYGIPASPSAYQDSRFHGFGPSIGLDLNYVVCNPIFLTGTIRYSGLVGDLKSSYDSSRVGGTAVNVTNESQEGFVSLIQSELALGYDFNFSDMFCGNFAIGYQLTKAIDSVQRFRFEDTASSAFITPIFNKSIHGYFARLTMDFAV